MPSVRAGRWVSARLPGPPAVEAYFCPGTVMAGLLPIYKNADGWASGEASGQTQVG